MNNIKEQLGPKCKTGYESYIIDEHSVTCPYIVCNNGETCGVFVPMENEHEQDKQ